MKRYCELDLIPLGTAARDELVIRNIEFGVPSQDNKRKWKKAIIFNLRGRVGHHTNLDRWGEHLRNLKTKGRK